jgi:peptidyl-prolyl cis-trans isomerase D
MIQTLKDVIHDSWVLKAFLGILTISFGVWGVGDFLTPGMDPNIAMTVGKTEISSDDLQRRFSRELDRFKQSLGTIDSEEMRRSILNALVQDMSRGAVIDAVGQDLGLVVTDARLRDGIRQETAFKDETGAFSQLQFNQVLYNNRLTEKGFLKIYASDIRQSTLMNPVLANSAAPQALVDTLIAYRGETRIADSLLVDAAALPAPPPASDEELKKVYDANLAAFTLPEYRKVSAVVVRADDLASPDSFTDDQLKAYYDENLGRYRTRETRHVRQLVFDTKEKAEAARALAAPGDRLDAVAAKAKLAPPVDLGELTADAPLAKSIGAAFDLPVNAISQPTETDLGWHLFEVTEIKPEVVRDFATVRNEIRKTLAADKGVDALYDASSALEDGIAGGTPLPELAEKVGGKLVTIEAMDRDGKDPRGLEAKGLFDNDRFAKTAFSLPAGGDSKLMEIPKGYYVLRVEAVTPATPKPFADVRGEVAAVAAKSKRQEAARERAKKLAGEIGPTTALSQIAAREKLVAAQIGPVNRFGEALSKDIIIDSKRISPELLDKLFRAKVGDVITAPVVDGVVIARLRDVIPASEGEVAKQRDQIAQNLRRSIGADLETALTVAFAERYPAKINSKALDTLVTSTR